MPTEISAGMQKLFATIPLWPLLAVVGIGLILAFNKFKAHAHKLTVIGVGISAVLSALLFWQVGTTLGHGEHKAEGSHEGVIHVPHVGEASTHTDAANEMAQPFTVFNWISLGQDHTENHQWIPVNFTVDGLTSIMLLFVCVVSLMVMIYSTGYMRDHHGQPEPGYERFFAFMALFVFSMCTLVLAGNFVLLYLGWELVGLCSYLLIGFYYKKPSAAAAAKKAFIVNRIGDFGFALGIFAIYYVLVMQGNITLGDGENPLDYNVVFKYAPEIGKQALFGFNAASVIMCLLFCGAIGKSAQFPLYVWLPDAMEGPSPVSALIHAATMVTAGVYMVARCNPLLAAAQIPYNDIPTIDVSSIILTVGVIGAVLAATMAMAQYDMKRILAYSTISQLAYMFVALGCNAPHSAIFHVYTHAFFKALLFLTAGSVMHAMGNVIDLRQFSGLKRTLPTTYKQMLIGCLALAGFPLLAGFWSKDEIVHAAFSHNPAVGVIMLITAGLTAYYTFRMFFLCFHGERRLPPEAGSHPHEMPAVMTGPLWFLAFGAIFAGYLGVTLKGGDQSFLGFLKPEGYFHHFLSASTVGTPHHAEGNGLWWLMYASAGIAALGIFVAWLRYGKAPQVDPDAKLLGPIFTLWNKKYWVDEIYHAVFVRPLHRLGSLFFGTDQHGIDGLVWFVSAVPRGLGMGLKVLQRGVLQTYALGMVIGIVLLIAWWLWTMPTT